MQKRLLALLALILACDQAPAAPMRGYSRAGAASEHALESDLAARLSRDSTAAFFRYFTDAPHPAGSVRNKELADFIAERFREYGLEEVKLHRYDVFLPWPREVKVEMIAPTRFTASLKEDAYPQDPHTAQDVGPTYMGMSASGDVTGELIYASSGNPEDYDWLKAQGIDVRGKIALVRYSVPYSYRGYKALTAERYGLKAMLIYSDPAQDGFTKGKTFPEGPYGPESHIQRGALSYDFMYAGDPLTPGYASLPGAPRIKPSESVQVPKIMSVPMSYRDAEPLLRALGGPEAPAGWQGALPFKYHVGAGPARVHVKIDMDGATRPIWVVEGRIRGTEEPDKFVLLGNHRDAWVFGAVDPSSGSATQMEVARVLGAMAMEGKRPKRTIVFASWDAEEWHLTGSTEWGEQFADDLKKNAIAYLNVDGSTSGSDFEAGAIASLNRLVTETVRDVRDPATGSSVLEAWGTSLAKDREAVIGGGATGGAAQRPIDYPGNALGSGSDYTVFLNHLGIPIVEMSFNGPYGVYHSMYDNRYWMEHHGDPGYRYMTAMGEVWGRMALRLANAEYYPHDFEVYSRRLIAFLRELEGQPGVPEHLGALIDTTRSFARAWGKLQTSLDSNIVVGLAVRPGAERSRLLAEVNEQMRLVEQSFLRPEGIPGRPWFKHQLYAPKYTYAAMTFPGVQEAVDAKDWPRASAQMSTVLRTMESAAGRTLMALQAAQKVR